MDLCVMPKPLARPRFDGLDMAPKPLLEPTERAASLDPVEFSGLSMSIPPPLSTAPLLCLRCRLAETVMVRDMAAAPGPGADLGGAAAIGTTPLPPTAPVVDPALPWKLVGLLTAVFPPDCPPLIGDSTGLTLPARLVAGGVAAWVDGLLAVVEETTTEFFLRFVPELLLEALIEFFLVDLVLVPPTGKLLPEPRFRFLMTSVFRLSGLTTP